MIYYNLYVSFVNGKIDEFNSDHGELVGENDTNDSLWAWRRLQYQLWKGLWAQFRAKILMHGKILHSTSSIAWFIFRSPRDCGWREFEWAQVHLRQHEVLFGGSRTAILLGPISHDSSWSLNRSVALYL